jgi:hypothetical protein
MMQAVRASLFLIALIFAPLVLLSRGNRRIRKQTDPAFVQLPGPAA